MGPGVRSTTTEPIAARASARAPNGMPTSWVTPSETDAAVTPAIIRSFDGATAIGATVLAFPSTTANTLPGRRTGYTGMLPSSSYLRFRSSRRRRPRRVVVWRGRVGWPVHQCVELDAAGDCLRPDDRTSTDRTTATKSSAG